jgi:hypothetical protein
MEARRPDPVRLSQFAVGERRFDVVSQIGSPLSTEEEAGDSCDLYKLVTHGVNRAGKAAIILGEAAADVYTLGLFEVIATPAEGATASAPHTVAFCYSSNKTLDFITESRPAGVVTVLGVQPPPGRAVVAVAAAPPSPPRPIPAKVEAGPASSPPKSTAVSCKRYAIRVATDPSQNVCAE